VKVSEGHKRALKVYILCILLVVAAEKIGLVKFKLGPAMILLVPFFHTIYLGLLAGWRRLRLMDTEDMKWASALVVPSVYVLMARYGTLTGPNFPTIIKAGIALVLQEIGNNWGSICIALPIAILLGLKREAIGACYSVGREPNLSLIGDIYGLDSPEGRGALGNYITGTVLGAAFFSLLGSLMAPLTPWLFHPISLGMASGVGSASMMTAASASLAAAIPAWKDQILAFAAASNLVTGATGLYGSWLVGLPFANWIYRKLEPRVGRRGRGKQAEKK